MMIYRKQYKEATPSADFDKLIESGETKQQDWFKNYYLDQKRQQEIIDEICATNKIKGHDKRKVSQEVWLGCSPTSIKSNLQVY